MAAHPRFFRILPVEDDFESLYTLMHGPDLSEGGAIDANDKASPANGAPRGLGCHLVIDCDLIAI